MRTFKIIKPLTFYYFVNGEPKQGMFLPSNCQWLESDNKTLWIICKAGKYEICTNTLLIPDFIKWLQYTDHIQEVKGKTIIPLGECVLI
jgi:hypothetical protein